MAVILLAKKLRALYPVDEAGEDWLRRLAQGEIIEVSVRRPRNVRFHRLFWALASLCWSQTDDKARYPTVESLVVDMKIATGHCDRRQAVVDGQTMLVLTPRSISFAAMDDTEFAAFYDSCSDWVAAHVLPGVSRADLRAEIESMIGAGEKPS